MRKLRRFVTWFLLVILLLAAAGYIYDRVATARDRAKYPRQGRLVDIGGYQIHLYCSGRGSPTVLLDAGSFDALEQWKLVQPEIAKFARVCSYDRPGLGWSDASPHQQTGNQIVSEFHAALMSAGEAGPFIYVGHSIAGLDALLFAAVFPSELAGIVLDDSVHPREYEQFPAHFPDHPLIFGALRLGAPVGLPRLLGFCKQSAARPDCGRFIGVLLKNLKAVELTYSQARAIQSLGNVPLLVLAHDPEVGLDKKRDPELELAWSKWQQDLASLSARSRLIVVQGCGHEIQTEKPAMVISAVRDLIGR